LSFSAIRVAADFSDLRVLRGDDSVNVAFFVAAASVISVFSVASGLGFSVFSVAQAW